MLEEPKETSLTKQQKTGVFLLSIFAVLAVGLGFLQIRNTMYAPFALNKSVPPIAQEKNNPQVLSLRDTDKDGLNDFEELYVYQTSPYLEDTDSDGIPDKQEVERGTNPLCPEGKNCGELGINGEAVPAPGFATSSGQVITSTSGLEDLEKVLGDPAQLRQMLLASGVDKKVLDATSDKDLLKMVKDILESTSTFR